MGLPARRGQGLGASGAAQTLLTRNCQAGPPFERRMLPSIFARCDTENPRNAVFFPFPQSGDSILPVATIRSFLLMSVLPRKSLIDLDHSKLFAAPHLQSSLRNAALIELIFATMIMG